MITIIDYGMGNLGSIKNMIKKLGFESVITSNPIDISKATKLILPGVGSFDKGMKNLRELDLIKILNEKVLIEKVPILGICLGMQLMTKRSDEGIEEGLGWVDAETVKFHFEDNRPIPHMGWNYIKHTKSSSVFGNSSAQVEERYYFVHSYYVKCNDSSITSLTCEYGCDFTCAFETDNIFATQFHPEKSHKFGMSLMSNFLRINQ